MSRLNLSAFTSFYNMKSMLPANIPQNLVMEHNFPWCSNGSYLIDPKIKQDDEFYLLENGSLYVTLSDIAISQPTLITNFQRR